MSAAAATTSTDPTAIIGFYQLAYGHSAFSFGLSTNTGSAVVRPGAALVKAMVEMKTFPIQELLSGVMPFFL